MLHLRCHRLRESKALRLACDLLIAMPDDDGGPPVFLIPPGADLEKLRGGPDVTFEGLMPKPGRYRAWTQFRRNDKIHTFAFTFNVVEP